MVEILTGGKAVNRDGYFYEPTIISNVNHEMDVIREEVFGPALFQSLLSLMKKRLSKRSK